MTKMLKALKTLLAINYDVFTQGLHVSLPMLHRIFCRSQNSQVLSLIGSFYILDT